MRTLPRRSLSITGVVAVALLLTVSLPLWLPLAVLADLVRGRFRCPIARLLLFALGWSWLESVAVMLLGLLWIGGQASNNRVHYALQRWWAARLMGILRVTTGIRVHAVGADALHPAPAVVLCRHASLADSLVSAWVITSIARLNPRYVLKRELLLDPCLDIVGNRLPNHFLDRSAADSAGELAALTALSEGLEPNDVAVIFPEGTRTSPAKRSKAMAKIRERDPQRADRLAALRFLLPPRPAGAAALLSGRPDADVVVAWHTGFDGLDTFSGILRHLATKPPPVHFELRRVPRSDVPGDDSFTRWLDDTWLTADAAVAAQLATDGLA
jgi:1-acyl-sn-glycerol-3-phosphate acyltransferase